MRRVWERTTYPHHLAHARSDCACAIDFFGTAHARRSVSKNLLLFDWLSCDRGGGWVGVSQSEGWGTSPGRSWGALKFWKLSEPGDAHLPRPFCPPPAVNKKCFWLVLCVHELRIPPQCDLRIGYKKYLYSQNYMWLTKSDGTKRKPCFW